MSVMDKEENNKQCLLQSLSNLFVFIASTKCGPSVDQVWTKCGPSVTSTVVVTWASTRSHSPINFQVSCTFASVSGSKTLGNRLGFLEASANYVNELQYKY